MARIRVLHWKAEEAAALLKQLRGAGYDVDYEEKPDHGLLRVLREAPPAAVVIDLSRLPSHGREVATGIRGSKATRHIPIVFVNGDREKVDAIRQQLPDAAYTTTAGIAATLRQAIAKAPADPVVPAQMMERYKERSAARKLGIAADSKIALFDAPPDYARVLGELPPGVSLQEHPRGRCDVTLWFVRDPASYQAGLSRMRARAASGKLWILWPKQKKARPAGDLSMQVIRESAIAVGLVDYKICAVNETWSGIAFAVKKG